MREKRLRNGVDDSASQLTWTERGYIRYLFFSGNALMRSVSTEKKVRVGRRGQISATRYV